MAKNEAKIKFTAETGEFNKAIQKANGEMSELRAELKLNETQMKATGASVEGLEKKHELLESQLKASESKTEALNQKVQKAVEIFGDNSQEASKLRTQLLNAQTAEEKLRQAVEQCANELGELKGESQDTRTASEKLTDTIDEQKTALDKLKGEYTDVVLEQGKHSKEARDLAKEIDSLSDELADNQKELSKAEKAADKFDNSLDNAGDAARDSADGFTVAKGAIAELAADAISAAIAKVSEFISYLLELPEATREIRQDMATLDTSFARAGFTSEQATQTWKDLYAVFGEDDRAVEAANLIAKMSDNQEDLNEWVTITKGIWGSYQDSLPVEGLAEASMETARTGQVTGVLADALNWSSEAATMFAKYMNDDVTTAEEAFNVALSECTTEEERQALITETLTALYGDAAAEYDKASGAQTEAKEATAENILVQNELADALEPVTTAWQELKNDALEAILPVVETVSGAMLEALEWMKEHPAVMKAVVAVVSVLAVGIGGLAIAMGVYAAAQWIANSAMFAFVAPILAVIAVIALIAGAVVLVIEYWDEIVVFFKELWEKVKETLSQWGEWINTNVIQPVLNFFVNLWSSITSACSSAWEWVKGVFSSFVNWIDSNIIQPVVNFFTGLWTSLQNIWDQICNVVQVAIMFIGSIISAAWQIITLPFRFIWENCRDTILSVWSTIKNAVSTAINFVKNIVVNVTTSIRNTASNIWNSLKNAISTAVNAVKNTVSNIWNSIKNVTSTVFNAVRSVASNIWNSVKNAISVPINAAKNAVSNTWNSIKNATSTAFNAVRSVASNIWNSVKSTVSSAVNSAKNAVSNTWNSVKSATSNAFNSVKSTATSVWNSIKNAITTPIEAAKNKVKSVIDAIKGFFSNLKLKLPDIKLPHFKIEGSFSLSPPSVPKLTIDWYKEGGILTRPTIFGMNGTSLMAGGEAGAEAILPIDKLEGYISNAIEKAQNVVNLDTLAAAIEDLANRPTILNINGRQFAYATAGDSDNVGGIRSTFKNRGLALE